MLHFDRNTQAYLDAMDADYNSFLSTPNISGTSGAMTEGVRHDLNKVFMDIEYGWGQHFKRIETGVESFKNKLVNGLASPLPSKYIGKERPVNHKIPYAVSGELWRSVFASVSYPNEPAGDNTWEATIQVGASSDHADLTNEGINSSRPNIGWYLWADHVFGTTLPAGMLHKSGIPDLRSVLLGYYS